MASLSKILLIAFCLFTSFAIAQKPTAVPLTPSNFFEYTPDSYSGRPNLPYDSTFTLKVHTPKKDNLVYALLLKGKKNTALLNLIGQKKYSYFNYKWDTSSNPTLILRFDKYFNKVKTSQDNDILKMSGHKKKEYEQPAGVLKPGNRYSIVLVHPVLEELFHTTDYTRDDNSLFNEFYRLSVAERNDDPNAGTIKNTVFYRYNNISKSVATNTGLPSIPKQPDSAYYYFQQSICIIYEKWDHYIDSIKSQVAANSKSDVELNSTKDCIGTLLKWISHTPCNEKDTASIKCRQCQDTSCNAIRALEVLYSLGTKDWLLINSGELSLVNYERGISTDVKAKTGNEKLANVKLSVQALRSVSDALRTARWQTEPGACDEAIISCEDNCISDCIRAAQKAASKEIDVLIDVSNDLKAILNAQVEFQKDVKLYTSDRFSGVDVLNTDTYIMDFETRNSVYITPVFGYTVHGFQRHFTDFSPYLGFQINFQAMNRNVPFNLIQSKTLLQRFCFTTAWTLKSVSAAGKRIDFFGNSSSLVTSLGFKFSHVIMLNVGTLWFRRINPNPLIVDKRIVATPLASLSINFNIAQFLNGFTGLIPSL